MTKSHDLVKLQLALIATFIETIIGAELISEFRLRETGSVPVHPTAKTFLKYLQT